MSTTPRHRHRPRLVYGYRTALSLLLLFAFQPGSFAQDMTQSNVSYTRNSVDVNRRSIIEVDPVTQALNIELPLGDFGSRGAGLPVAMNYNSKVWRVNGQGVYQFPTSFPPSPPNYMTLPLYSEHSTAGWTNSLGVPFLEDASSAEPYAVWFSASNNFLASANSGLPWDEFFTVAGPPQCEEHPGTCIFPAGYYVARVRVHMPDGASHELRCPVDGANAACAGGFLVAVDGSHMRYDFNQQILYLADGSHYLLNTATGAQYIDRNGNTLTFAAATGQWTDTLDRHFTTPPITYFTIDGPGNYPWNLPGTNGPNTYHFRWQKLQDARTDPDNNPLLFDGDTHFGGVPELPQYEPPSLFTSGSPAGGSAYPAMMFRSSDEHFNPDVLTDIELPNGKKYSFSYNNYGEIDKVTLPSGGYKRYLYAAIPPLGGDMFSVYAEANRGVVSMWESVTGLAADESPVPWTFSGSETDSSVKTTAPDGSYTTRTLYSNNTGDPVHFGFNNNGRDALTGKTIEERSHAANGDMLRRTVNTWACTTQPNSPYSIYYPQPIPVISYASRDARLVEQTQIIFDTAGSALAQTTTFEYDADLNVIAKKTHDFVSVDQNTAKTSMTFTHGTLLRTEETTYLVNDLSLSPTTRAAYRARNMVTLPTSARVMQGTNPVAQTAIHYDETGLAACPGLINWTDPGSNVPRGNPTTTSRWVNTTGAWLDTHTGYDQAGNAVSSTDALGHTTTTSYQDSFTDNSDHHTYAFPTHVLTAAPDPSGVQGSAVGLTSSTKYDLNTGLPMSTTDPNGRTTTFEYNDPLNRLRKVNRPDGGWTKTDYNDDPASLYLRTQVLRQATPTEQVTDSYQYFDGFARPSRSYLYDGTANTPWSVTETKYDTLGRVSQVSNPYRVATLGTTGTAVWSTTEYDALGRVTIATMPGGAKITTKYAGTRVLVKDPAGKKRMSETNALGQLTDVWEIKPQDSWTEGVSFAFDTQVQFGYRTSYTYDLIDNMLTVTQGTQPARGFVYDSLKRILSSTNPESGTVSYQYDAAGNVKIKTDARLVSTHFDYDSLNRLKRRWYNGSNELDKITNNLPVLPGNVGATDEAKFYYDAALPASVPLDFVRGDSISRLVAGVYGTSDNGDFYGYDVVGQVNVKFQQVAGINYKIGPIVYNLAGALVSEQYPSGRIVSNTYDAAGRTSGVAGNLGDNNQRNYATGISYDAAGRLAQEQFGTTTPVYNKLFYNSRGQVSEILAATTGNDASWNRGKIVNDYTDECSGASCNGTNNNGNLRKQTMYVPINEQNTNPIAWSQQFDYDYLNRLERVHEYTGTPSLDWQQEFAYDRLGNRSISLSGTTDLAGINRMQAAVLPNTTTNRMHAPGQSESTDPLMGYDQAGNQIKDYYTDPHNIDYDRTYDAEDRLKTSTAIDGGVSSTSIYSYDPNGRRIKRKIGNVETWQVYGVTGELVAEYAQNALSATPQKEYGYRNGQLLITAEPSSSAPLSLGAGPANNNPNSSIALSWSATSGATNYGIERKAANTSWGSIGTSPSNSFSDTGAVLGTPYLYRICVANAGGTCTSGYSNVALGSRFNFPTDPTIISNADHPGGSDVTIVKLDHITELRAAVNAVRHLAGLGDATWTNSNLTRNVSPIKKEDVQDLRDGLDQALRALGIPALSYEDQTLASGPSGTPIKAAHIRQLRDRATRSNGVKLQPVAATASASHSSPYDPSHAIDGNINTLWSAGAVAPQWIQLDLGQLSTISQVRLLVDQYPNGHTIHQVYGGPTPQNLTLLGTFDGNTSFGQWLELSTAATGVRYLKVQTTESPSWVGWAEIEVYGSGSGNSGQIHWLLADQLGTPRMNFDQSGSLATMSRHDYLPFGEELPNTVGLRPSAPGYGVADGARQQFTDKERDTETGLDYFLARYYSSIQGRFTSSDPGPFIPGDPQSYNRYAYVQNNPLKFIDPTGEELVVNGDDAEFFVEELERLSGLALDRDKKTGVVTLAKSQKGAGKGSKELAKEIKGAINLKNKDGEKATVTLNTVKNDDSYTFDNFQTRSIDIADYKAFATMPKDNGAFAAAQVGHVLAEYSAAETTHKDLESGGNDIKSPWFNTSHNNEGLAAEGRIMSEFTGKPETAGRTIKDNTTLVGFEYTSVRYLVDRDAQIVNGQRTIKDNVTKVTRKPR